MHLMFVGRQQVQVKLSGQTSGGVNKKKATLLGAAFFSNMPTYCTVTAIVELMPPVPEIVTV
jgi:hypothetical protein